MWERRALWGSRASTARNTRLGKSGRIAKLLRKMCSTTWHNFFRAKSKKIFDFFFASPTQTVLKNTQHGPKNLIFLLNMPNSCADFLGPFPIFQLTWKNSNSKKCPKKSEKNVPKLTGPHVQVQFKKKQKFLKIKGPR